MGLVDGLGLAAITVDVAAGAERRQVEQAVCEEIERFIAEGPDQAEGRSSPTPSDRWLSTLASTGARRHISHHCLLTGDPGYINTFVERLREVSATDDARGAAAAWLDPDSRAVVRYLTDTSGRSEEGSMTDVIRPVVAPPAPWGDSPGEHADLPND